MIDIYTFNKRAILYIIIAFLLIGMSLGQAIKLENGDIDKLFNSVQDNFIKKDINILLKQFMNILFQIMLFVILIGVKIGYILYFIPSFTYTILGYLLNTFIIFKIGILIIGIFKNDD
jgi:hypothetical protein